MNNEKIDEIDLINKIHLEFDSVFQASMKNTNQPLYLPYDKKNIKKLKDFDLNIIHIGQKNFFYETPLSLFICQTFFDQLNCEEQLFLLKNFDLNKIHNFNQTLTMSIFSYYTPGYFLDQNVIKYILQNSDLNIENQITGDDFFTIFHSKRTKSNYFYDNSFLFGLNDENFNIILDKYSPNRVNYKQIFELALLYKQEYNLKINFETLNRVYELSNKQPITNNEVKEEYSKFLSELEIKNEKNILFQNIDIKVVNKNILKNKI